MAGVPFRVTDLFRGIARCHGVIHREDDCLVIEYRLDKSLVGFIRSGKKEARIPLQDITFIALQRTWLGLRTHLAIQADHRKNMEDVPGMKQGRIVLAIARRDRPAADKLVQQVKAGLQKG